MTNIYVGKAGYILISPEFLKNSDAVRNIQWIPSKNVKVLNGFLHVYGIGILQDFFQDFLQKFLMKFQSSNSVRQRRLLQGAKSTGNFGLVIST